MPPVKIPDLRKGHEAQAGVLEYIMGCREDLSKVSAGGEWGTGLEGKRAQRWVRAGLQAFLSGAPALARLCRRMGGEVWGR